MSHGYVIAWVDVTDPVQYEEYRKWSTPAIAAYGGEVCVRGGQSETLEGNWSPTRIVVIKFASYDKAKAFYDSPEYRKARDARQGAAIMRMIVVEGT